MIQKIEEILDWVRHRATLMENLSYVTILQIFYVVSPLITYPYLTRVLGTELYGLVITAQVLVSYASLIINFGSDKVCAKHVAINQDNKDKQSEVLCSVFFVRLYLWGICLFVYAGLVFLIPTYRNAIALFMLFYGTTFNDLLFPQFFFQGIEKMKYSTVISVGARTLFIILVFFVVKTPNDYLYVPILYALGSIISGIISFVLLFVKMQYRFYLPSIKTCCWYVKDCSPLFAVDLILTIKDKFNVLLLGLFSGMSNVVVYDLGTKINSFVNKPNEIISTVMLPRFSRDRDTRKFKKVLWVVALIAAILIIIVNIFLPYIVYFFIHEEINLWPIRLFSIAPLFLSVSSCIAYNLLVAFGYNKYQLYSIIVATGAYLLSLFFIYITNNLSSLYGFIIMAMAAYFVELLYRIYLAKKVIAKETDCTK